MRVAFLTPEYARPESPEGGLANYLSKICSLLKERGHDPVVFLSGRERRRMQIEGIDVIEAPPPSRAFEALRGPFGLIRLPLQRWIAARHLADAFAAEHACRPFDVIQAANFQAVGVALSGRAPVPVVVRVSSVALSVLRRFDNKKDSPALRLADWLEWRAIRRADAVFAPSRFLAAWLEKNKSIRAHVIRTPFVPPSGKEDPAFYDSLLARKEYVLYIGRMNLIKGADVLALALRSLLQERSGLHAAFVGPDDMLSDGHPVSALIRDVLEPWKDRIYLLPPQSRERLAPLIRHARLVAAPSRCDNYPNACLEAQALGRIVVGTRNTSLDEMIEDGVTGFLAEMGSPDSFSAALA
ncbi:MAG: glycosyltransferase family 4 protein, partial [Candidatus Sumerlaeota bacterium]|nr:glycosyltransferase family 4 protein [Candidatus Sumerlaeota bacterium]